MKIFKVLMILLISSCSYYGVVNDKGEKVTNIQEIMQEQENEIVVEQIIEEQVSETMENVVAENKQEESKEIIQQEEKAEVKKEETKVATNQKPKTQTTTKTKKVEQEEKKVEKVVESKAEETTKQVEIQETVVEEKKVEEKQEEKVVTNAEKCATGNHGMGVGNSGKWFKTKDEAIATYRAEIKIWGDKWTDKDNPISDEDYYANCPYGYEVWTCPYCNLWTLNYYYDK